MPKKRHLHITLATDQAETEKFIEGEIQYRSSKTGHENTWSYTGLDRARVPPPSEDDLFDENRAIFLILTVAEINQESTTNRLRPFLAWLVEGADSPEERSKRKLSLIAHGGGETTVAGHADKNTVKQKIEMDQVMNCICGAAEQRAVVNGGQWDGNDKPNCSICSRPFTFVHRRHHCRACGQSVCSSCCSKKSISNALIKNTRDTANQHGNRTRDPGLQQEFVCDTCENQFKSRNLLNKLGVLRLCVCCAALRRTGIDGYYILFPDQTTWAVHADDEGLSWRTRKFYDPSNLRMYLPDACPSKKPILVGQSPTLQTAQDPNQTTGHWADEFVERTVAGKAVQALRARHIEGVKVTACKGMVKPARRDQRAQMTTSATAGNFRTIQRSTIQNSTNNWAEEADNGNRQKRQKREILLVQDGQYGGETLGPFTEEKLYVYS